MAPLQNSDNENRSQNCTWKKPGGREIDDLMSELILKKLNWDMSNIPLLPFPKDLVPQKHGEGENNAVFKNDLAD